MQRCAAPSFLKPTLAKYCPRREGDLVFSLKEQLGVSVEDIAAHFTAILAHRHQTQYGLAISLMRTAHCALHTAHYLLNKNTSVWLTRSPLTLASWFYHIFAKKPSSIFHKHKATTFFGWVDLAKRPPKQTSRTHLVQPSYKYCCQRCSRPSI